MAITTNGGAGVTADAVATLSNKTLAAPIINNATFTGAQAGLEIKFGNSIVLEGATDDAFEVTLSGGDPTSDRVITLPDLTGTVVLRDTVETLTNKTISATSNTLTGVINNTLTSTTGDTIYASGANTPARLAVGTTGQVLTVAGGVPTWATPAAGTTANDQAFAFAVQVFA